MTDPFLELGLPPESDDAAIRARYLELVKRYPPEQYPQRFARLREAYEAIRDRYRRVTYRLFEKGSHETAEAIIEDLTCRTPRPRIRLKDLIKADSQG